MKRIIPAQCTLNATGFMRLFFIPLLFFCFPAQTLYAQVSLTATLGNPSGSYTTLKVAFDSINTGFHRGDIIISITGSITETAPAVVNYSGLSAASYSSVRIAPLGGAFSISGGMAAGSPLIDLNGADNVIIDGLNDGVNALTITNTTVSATAGTSTIRFIGGATNNTITNCSILGSSASSVSIAGGNIFFSTDANTTNGNDNNVVSYCSIGPAGANLPAKGIYMSGSTTNTTIANSGNTFTYNNIFDYFGAAFTSAGLYISGGNTDNTISYNKFYQTATRTQTAGIQHSAIWISNSSGNNFLVRGNRIGYSNVAGSGMYNIVLATTFSSFVPIYLNVGTTAATSIQDNYITAIAVSGAGTGTAQGAPFRAIFIGSGVTAIGDINGNTIGSLTANGSITYTSSATTVGDVIGMFNNGTSNWVVGNNNIGGITASNSSTGGVNVYGIYCNTTPSATFTATNNIIGGTVANSIQSTPSAATCKVSGIIITLGGAILSNNLIRNLTCASGNSGTTTSAAIIGISIAAPSSNHSVSKNVVTQLNSTAVTVATTVCGIQFTGSTGLNLVAGNFIHSLSNTSTSGVINGINISGGTAAYQNNMISVGYNEAGASIATGCAINGINEPSSSTSINKFYFNSIYVGGTGVAGSASTFAFNSLVINNTRNIRNNIFYNARSNGAGTGKHYAIQVGGTAANPVGLTINYNDYLANGTGSVFGRFSSSDILNIATWKSAVGQDVNSLNDDPQYLNPTGNAASVNLHINAAVPTPVESAGIAISGIADDYDADLRASTPDIGADEISGIPLSAPLINSVSKNPNAIQCIATARTITANITAGSYNLTSVTLKYSYNNGIVVSVVMTGGSTTAGTTSDWAGVIPAATPTNAIVTWSVTATDGINTRIANGISYADVPIPDLVITAAPNPICPGDTATFTVGIVPPTVPAANTYCVYTHQSCVGDYVSHVVLNTLNNNSGSTCGNASHYVYFNGGGSQTTTLAATTSYNLSVTVGFDGSQYVGAWIDYDHNGIYSASEFVSAGYSSVNLNVNGTINIPVIVPKTAYNGLTHMRIVGGPDVAVNALDACGSATGGGYYGETQDYDITITGGTDLAPLPAAGVSVIWSTGGNVVGNTNPLGQHPVATSIYTATVTDGNGCSYSSNITEVVLLTTSAFITDSACYSYTLNDSVYTTSGTYIQHLKNAAGCDSAITLSLVIQDSTSGVLYDTACNSYTLNDSIYTASGTYTQHLTNVVGCDSTLRLHLIINYLVRDTTAVSICSYQLSYLWHNHVYTTAGVYSDTLLTQHNCDSISVLLLTVNTGSNTHDTETACGSYYWPRSQGGTGNVYTTSGDYLSIFYNATNCPDTFTLHLIINASPSNMGYTHTACDFYKWEISTGGNDIIYTTSGVYSYTSFDVNGCPYTVTLNLNIFYSTSSDTTVIACESYWWPLSADGTGQTYTASGIYTNTRTNASGCPHTSTLHLTIHPSPYSNTNDTVCQQNLPYQWNGNNYNASGNYSVIFHLSNGCDSTANLKLFVKICPPPQCCPGINLIVNGTFEDSLNSGFQSYFTRMFTIAPMSVMPGRYALLTNAQALMVSPTWNADCEAYNRHLVVNGFTGKAAAIAWQQSVTLGGGKTYKFCADFKNLNQCRFNVLPRISVLFGGLSSVYTVPYQTINASTGCGWQRIEKVITVPAGTSLTVVVRIMLDQSASGDGNDVAIDNINLVEMPKVAPSLLNLDLVFSNITATSFSITATPVTSLNNCTSFWQVEQLDSKSNVLSATRVVNPASWLPLASNNFPGYDYHFLNPFPQLAYPGLFNVKKRYRIIYGRTCDCTVKNTFALIVDPTTLPRGGKPVITYFEDSEYNRRDAENLPEAIKRADETITGNHALELIIPQSEIKLTPN